MRLNARRPGEMRTLISSAARWQHTFPSARVLGTIFSSTATTSAFGFGKRDAFPTSGTTDLYTTTRFGPRHPSLRRLSHRSHRYRSYECPLYWSIVRPATDLPAVAG